MCKLSFKIKAIKLFNRPSRETGLRNTDHAVCNAHEREAAPYSTFIADVSALLTTATDQDEC
jgi:hypothetical protein